MKRKRDKGEKEKDKEKEKRREKIREIIERRDTLEEKGKCG
jgi:hypothetical protein